jgi:two-component system, chemotaxis family, CheB/CheR fusion protein
MSKEKSRDTGRTRKAKQPSRTQQPEAHAPSLIIGIGASAGGLEAIESFFTNTPADTSFAYVVIQHLSPDYKSLMVEILSKKTTMPVLRAEDGMVVEAATVYLIPPKKNLTIYHNRLILSEQDYSHGINLPIDIFLRSLAEDANERAVAVILSGTGSDGTRGVRNVKEHGGLIIVQDEGTAKFDGMPRAAASTGLADFILPPQEMPAQLLAFAAQPHTPAEARIQPVISNEDGLTRIFSVLRANHKVDFSAYKLSTVSRRIERRMTINHFDDVSEYALFLERTPAEAGILFRELLIGVTSFFRDPAIFERLSTEVIPELLETSRDRELRLWVSGCSTGEEAYTLAMLLREGMEKTGISRDVKIFATDIDRNAIHFAAVGSYPESVAADIPKEYLGKYFYRRDDHFQISRTIREMVVFAAHNLVKDPPFTNIDMVSCRNLLIYLQQEAQVKVLKNFNFSLVRNGILLLGSSETTGDMSDHFEPIEAKMRIYRARGSGKDFFSVNTLGAGDTRVRDMKSRYTAGRRSVRSTEETVLDRFVTGLAGEYLPASAIVSEHLEVRHLVGEIEGIFRFPSGRPSMEIDKIVVKDLVIPLTTGIQKVFRTRMAVRFTGVGLEGNGVSRRIDIRILPLPDRPAQEPLVAVIFDESEKAESRRDEMTVPYDVNEETTKRLEDLEQELQFTRENLQATIEELETSNEELQATNEELLASNEELQSTNEELQSTNEELYTVNTEYQKRIMELTELNNDVENLLESSGIGTVLLDENLAVRRFSSEATQVFRLMESDLGRPISHISHHFQDFDPYPAIDEVLSRKTKREWQVRDKDGTWRLFRVTPYRISPRDVAGAVLSIIDISEMKGLEEERDSSRELLAHVADNSPSLKWMSDTTGECIWFNRTWLNFTGRSMEEEVGTGWTEGVHPEDFDQCLETYRNAFDRKVEFSMEYRLRHNDGTYRWILDKGTPRYSDDGTFLGYIGSCLDITDRKRMEEQLREHGIEHGC